MPAPRRLTPAKPRVPVAPTLDWRLENALRSTLKQLEPVPKAARSWSVALEELCLRPSKRIRPRLCALAYQGVSRREPEDGVLVFAAGLELLHTFMLVHDDLIDRSVLRRGGPALHRTLARGLPVRSAERAAHLAMLGGDALFAAAVATMAAADVPEGTGRQALLAVLGSARQAALGEYLDVVYAGVRLKTLTTGALAEVLRLKTASYTFVGPLLSGAILGGSGLEGQRVLTSFGERVGTAFQLADDLLDFFGTRVKLGKPIGGDLREGKRTVLMRLLVDRVEGTDRQRLTRILEQPAHAVPVSVADVRFVTQLLARSGVAGEMVTRVRNLVSAAQRELARVELEPGAAGELRALAGQVIDSLQGLAT